MPTRWFLLDSVSVHREVRRPAASVLGVSQSLISKLEINQKTLSRNDLDRYLEKLAEAGRQARWVG